MDRPPLPALTGIRFFAALHVVFFHYAPGMPLLLRNVAGNGYMAVGLFFILSGFVLAYNYAGRPMNVRRFLGARFARIYPAYLLGLLWIAPAVAIRLMHSDPGTLVAAGLASISLLQAWFPHLALVWNGPGWSLSNEAFFYLLFPVMLPQVLRLSDRRLWIVAAVCWAAAVVPPLVMLAWQGGQHAEAVMYMPVFRLAEFLLGVAAGVAYSRKDRESPGPAGPLALTLTAFAVLSPFWIHPLLRGAVAAPLFAAFVYCLAAGGGALGRFLASKPLQVLGDASYATYVLQSPLMAWFLFAAQGIHGDGQRHALGWLQFAAYTAILIGASLACSKWLETPARRWIQSRAVPKDWNRRISISVQAPVLQGRRAERNLLDVIQATRMHPRLSVRYGGSRPSNPASTQTFG